MYKRNDGKHMVDILFMIALFCVFAVSALMLVILGADVYKKTVSDMDQNYTSRTAFSYISEKIRQNDLDGNISVTKFGDGDAIEISETYSGTEYVTYLYMLDSSLCELGMLRDSNLSPENGDKIIELQSLQIENVSEQLYRVLLTPVEEDTITLYISTHSKK